MEAHTTQLGLERKLTKPQKEGRRLEQTIDAALFLLKISMNHNDYSDEGYPLSQGGPGDHWDDLLIIEDKNLWSCGGKTKRSASWVKKNILKRPPYPRHRKNRSMPIVPRKKLLIISTFSALTKPAIDLLLDHNWMIVAVGYPVLEGDEAEAIMNLVLQLYPIVTAIYHSTTEAEAEAEEHALHDEQLLLDLLYEEALSAPTPDFDFLPDDSMPEPDEELFDQPPRSS